MRYFHEYCKTWHFLIKINSVCPPRVSLAAGCFFTFISIKLFVGYYSTLEYKGMYFVSWVNIVKDETLVCFLVPQIPFWWQFCFDAHTISRPIWKKKFNDSAAQSIYIFVHSLSQVKCLWICIWSVLLILISIFYAPSSGVYKSQLVFVMKFHMRVTMKTLLL